MGSQTCEPVSAKSCSWVTYVAAWGLSRDCTFLFEDGKRLSHNPLNVLLLCVGKTEYHVIRVCPEGGIARVCVRCVRAVGGTRGKEGRTGGWAEGGSKNKTPHSDVGNQVLSVRFIAITIGITIAITSAITITVLLPLPILLLLRYYWYCYFYYAYCYGGFPGLRCFRVVRPISRFSHSFCFSCQFLCVVRMFLFLSIFPFFTSVHLGCAPLS